MDGLDRVMPRTVAERCRTGHAGSRVPFPVHVELVGAAVEADLGAALGVGGAEFILVEQRLTRHLRGVHRAERHRRVREDVFGGSRTPVENSQELFTVATVVGTHDLAKGVFVGVILSALQFARKIAKEALIDSVLSADGRTRTYAVHGQLFFVTVEGFLGGFDYQEKVERVVIDLSGSHIWDHSAVAALDKAVLRLRRGGAAVEVVGMNEATASLLDRLAVHDKPGAMEMAIGH